MAVLYLDDDTIELVHNCLVECGYEDLAAEIILMFDEVSSDEEPIKEDIGDQKKIRKKQRAVYQEG
tara:strand:+ start:2075 stop:2272 length:198 start_codon:yes stop_codon:yes gene_type:complete